MTACVAGNTFFFTLFDSENNQISDISVTQEPGEIRNLVLINGINLLTRYLNDRYHIIYIHTSLNG